MSEPAIVEPAPPGAERVPWELVVPEAELDLIGYGMKTYGEIEALVLAAQTESPPVALATYGSRMFGTCPAHRLTQAPFFEGIGGTDRVTLYITRSSTITRLRNHLLKLNPLHFGTTGTGVGARAFRADIETLRLADLHHSGDGTASTPLVPRARPYRHARRCADGLRFRRTAQAGVKRDLVTCS